VAILAGVDRLMDSFHTLLNVIGNVANAVILERWEGPNEVLELDEAAAVSDLA
jgi:proton glutamate symport protein